MLGTTKICVSVLCCLALVVCTTAQAGVLDGHPFAYDDDLGPQGDGSWSGSAPFANDGLNGTIDWAVFNAGTFNLAFAGSGYVGAPNTLVYAYQLNAGGTLGATSLTIILDGHPAFSDGSFSGGGVTGSDITFTYVDPGVAFYTFDATAGPNSTDGMAYSSTRRPQLTGVASVVDGGTSVDASAFVAIPGPMSIPEPATGLMATLAIGFLGYLRRRK